MIVKVRQLLLRTVILLAVTVMIAGLFLLLPRHAQGQEITLADEAAGAAWLTLHGWRADAPVQQTAVMPAQWQTVSGQRFLALQQQQGLAPERHAGETAVSGRRTTASLTVTLPPRISSVSSLRESAVCPDKKRSRRIGTSEICMNPAAIA